MCRGAGIICVDYAQQDHILCVKGRESGKWGFPKGHRLVGESATACALREFGEETGATLEYINSSDVFKGASNIYYTISISREKITFREQHDVTEISEICWLSVNDLMSFNRQQVNIDLWAYIYGPLMESYYEAPDDEIDEDLVGGDYGDHMDYGW